MSIVLGGNPELRGRSTLIAVRQILASLPNLVTMAYTATAAQLRSFVLDLLLV